MGILENFENAWDPEFQLDVHPLIELYKENVANLENESKPMPELDDMGRDKSNYI